MDIIESVQTPQDNDKGINGDVILLLIYVYKHLFTFFCGIVIKS